MAKYEESQAAYIWRAKLGIPNDSRRRETSMTKPVRTLPKGDYPVFCHRCPVDVPVLMRSQATLHGTHQWGGLWHCPSHADDCTREPHGDYCDANCIGGNTA